MVSQNTYRFIPHPISRHKIRPDAIACVVKLTIGCGGEGVCEVRCRKLVVQEDPRVSHTKFVCSCHPRGRVFMNWTCILEFDSLEWRISFLDCVYRLVHFLNR